MNILYFVLGIATGVLATLLTADWRDLEAERERDALIVAHRNVQQRFDVKTWSCK